MAEIIHLQDRQKFQTTVDGVTAYLTYRITNGCLDVRHTIVPQEIGGRGIAAALVKTAYDYAQQQQLIPVATCSFAVKWLERHPEYNGRTGSDYANGSCAL